MQAIDPNSFEQHLDAFVGGDDGTTTKALKTHLNVVVDRVNAIGDWADDQKQKKNGGGAAETSGITLCYINASGLLAVGRFVTEEVTTVSASSGG